MDLGGFADAPRDSAYAFRAALSALARPGRIERLTGASPPEPLSQAAGILILVLCDPDTPIHLAGGHDRPAVRDWIAFHAGAPISGHAECAFAVGVWEALLPIDRFPVGTPDYPDRSATLIVEVQRLEAAGARLAGPGIKTEARLSLPDIGAFQANHARYPMGVDTFLTCGERVAGLPRSTAVQAP